MPRADDLPSFDLGFNGTPLHDQSAGRQRLRRGGRDRGLSGHRQRHPRRPGAARRERFRGAGHAGACLAGHEKRAMRRHDEAPRASDGPQPPAHPRRAAPAPAGSRPRAGSGERLGRAHHALRRSLAQARFPAERSRQRRSRQHRRLGARDRPRQCASRRGARCAIEGLARRTGRRGALLQHDPHRALAGGDRPDRRRRPAAVERWPPLSLWTVPPRRPTHGAEQRGLRPRPAATQPGLGRARSRGGGGLCRRERLRPRPRSSRCRPTISR